MSANSAVTVLRSPSRASDVSAVTRTASKGFADVLPLLAPMSTESAAVHWPQNLNPGGFWNWHLGQTNASGSVHWPQNLIPAGFSKPHFEHCIPDPQGAAGRPLRMPQSRAISHFRQPRA